MALSDPLPHRSSRSDVRSARTTVARAIIALGNSLGLPIVAEGIETPEQLLVLRRLGCELGQGYLFGKPMAGEDLEPLLLRSAMTRAIA